MLVEVMEDVSVHVYIQLHIPYNIHNADSITVCTVAIDRWILDPTVVWIPVHYTSRPYQTQQLSSPGYQQHM